MIVVKVGGSLYDLPDLADRLRRFLASLEEDDLLLVPGGGEMANVVRALDRLHGLGAGPSHWLALRACSLNAHFLRELLPECAMVGDPMSHRGRGILDPFAFVQRDEGRPGCLPHEWDATSDSVAARVAIVCGARLILLKSVSWSASEDWDEAARTGVVDPVLPGLIRESGLRAEVVNVREPGSR